MRYSILNIEREIDGTLETCLELGVYPLAHTPLARVRPWVVTPSRLRTVAYHYIRHVQAPTSTRTAVTAAEGASRLQCSRRLHTGRALTPGGTFSHMACVHTAAYAT